MRRLRKTHSQSVLETSTTPALVQAPPGVDGSPADSENNVAVANNKVTTPSLPGLSSSRVSSKRVKMALDTSYTELGNEVWKNFEKTGRTEFLKFLKHHVKENNNPIFDKSSDFKRDISGAIYDLCWHALRHTIKKDLVLAALGDAALIHSSMPEVILDIINIIDCETSIGTDSAQEDRLMFSQLVKDLEKVIPDAMIKERLEIDTLQDVGVVKSKAFYSKFIKIKTKLYYKQRRFNLFREENEGYAKLITELNQDFDADTTAKNVMDIIKSLIGCFNLDPNRVLDTILESFEARPECWQLFVPLLRTYMSNGLIICEVLGYKFRHFAEDRTPKSLFNVCALLLKHGVIELSSIYVWLNPPDKDIADQWEKELSEAREFVRKLNIVLTNKEKEPAEVVVENDDVEERYERNQKFGLCEHLLKVGDWENAHAIMKKLPEQSVVVHQLIAEAISRLIHISIDHIYTEKCFTLASARRYSDHEDTELVKQFMIRDFSDMPQKVFPMVIALGPSLHFDTTLMFKLVRVLRSIVIDMGVDNLNTPPFNSEAEDLYYDVMTVMDAAILPALSYLDCNCPMAEDIWTVLKVFPYYYRYSLYGRWKNDTYQMQPELIRRRGLAQKQIKGLMKRVSKENVKPVGRLIGKHSHCAPGTLFEYMLVQIQIYDNLIGPVVDSLKYLTSLSFDCLGYCIIEALARADRDRIKHDGTSISLWLQSLASFCGAVFKKYNIELSGLLQYVANQLKSQKSLDLLILKEIVQKMAGVESAEEMTNEQLNAMCGGELLRGEAGYFSQVRNTKKSSQRLKEALANNDLAVAISLLMAQQKHCVIYRETARSHLKLVGKLYDQCQDTLVQFGTFLGSTYSVDEYVERLPSIIAMLREYHINTDVAFFLARPMFSHQINQKYDQLRKADPNAKKLTSNQKLLKYIEATNIIMNPIIESVRPLHSPKIWDDISPQFLVTFWSLSMYDLQVPAESYQKEVLKLKQLCQHADSKDSVPSKSKKEQERYVALMEKLQDERKKQQEHVDKILQCLQQQKDSWFLSRSAKSAKNETITQFLQLCLFPRCTFTALDSLYCAKFVHTIHNLKAANFSTLLCYDRIFCDITYSVTILTENEATRYGRFLCAMLETVMRWHADQATFNRECANYPGFVTKFRVSNQFSEANDHVGFENYRHVCHKWHYKITKAIVFCLDSKDYMQIRNALIILMRILPHYPSLAKLSQILERKVEKVREEEKNQRPDLFAIASSYIGQLKSRASLMVKESDFHQVSERPGRVDQPGMESGSSASLTPLTTVATVSSTTSNAGQSNPAQTAIIIPPPPIPVVVLDSPTSSRLITNGDHKTFGEKREKSERQEKPKVLKLSNTEKDRESTSNTIVPLSLSSRGGSIIVEAKEDQTTTAANINLDRDYDRHSSSRSVKELVKEERTREREQRDRERERDRDRDRERERDMRDRDQREQRDLRERELREQREQRDIRDQRELREPRELRELREQREQREQRDIRDQRETREREPRERRSNNEDINDTAGNGNLLNNIFASSSSGPLTRTKREKRRDEKHRMASPTGLEIIEPGERLEHDYERSYERDREKERLIRERERDLSSVSNESNTSLPRRNAETIEYEKDSKRRKVETSTINSKKILLEDTLISLESAMASRKERSSKIKDRKDKLTDEEKDARKERKLGRKRERLEETTSMDHKRRREIQNGDDDVRERDKYHLRDKSSPHIRDLRERSHEKFERERSSRDERQYSSNVKPTRSRIGY